MTCDPGTYYNGHRRTCEPCHRACATCAGRNKIFNNELVPTLLKLYFYYVGVCVLCMFFFIISSFDLWSHDNISYMCPPFFSFLNRHRNRGVHQVCRWLLTWGLAMRVNMQYWLLPVRADLRQRAGAEVLQEVSQHTCQHLDTKEKKWKTPQSIEIKRGILSFSECSEGIFQLCLAYSQFSLNLNLFFLSDHACRSESTEFDFL